jgi:hypothetical protein
MSRERTRPTKKHRDLGCQTVLCARLDRMRALLLEWDESSRDRLFFLKLSPYCLARYIRRFTSNFAHRYNSAQVQRKPD